MSPLCVSVGPLKCPLPLLFARASPCGACKCEVLPVGILAISGVVVSGAVWPTRPLLPPTDGWSMPMIVVPVRACCECPSKPQMCANIGRKRHIVANRSPRRCLPHRAITAHPFAPNSASPVGSATCIRSRAVRLPARVGVSAGAVYLRECG